MHCQKLKGSEKQNTTVIFMMGVIYMMRVFYMMSGD